MFTKKTQSSFVDSLVIFCIRIYQVLNNYFNQVILSVFGVVSTCPQHPTCSEYTILQIRQHGTIPGLKKGVIRVWHCRGNRVINNTSSKNL